MRKKAIIPAITLDKLQRQTEKLVRVDSMTYTEAVCEICESMLIDPTDMARIIKGSLKEKLEVEAIERNILKSNTAKLY